MSTERPPLEEMTLRQLRRVASEYGVSRYSRMRKEQLLEAIKEAQRNRYTPSPSRTLEAQAEVAAAKFDVGQTDRSGGSLAIVDEGLPDLPDGYGESRIVLLPRDPQWAYAYWDVSNEAKEALRRQGGIRLALRFYDVTDINIEVQRPHSLQQYECDELAREWYLPIPVSDRDYVIEIGYITGDGRWLLLARSAAVRIPPVYPSDWIDDQFITVGWDDELRSKIFLELSQPGKSAAARTGPLYDQVFELAQVSEAQRVAGSVFGSVQQVPEEAISSYVFPSGVGKWASTESGVGMMSGVGMAVTGMSGVGRMSGVGLYSESGVGMYSESGVGMYTMSGVGRYSESGVGLYSESGVGMYTMSGVGVTGMSGIGMMSGVGITGMSGIGMGVAGMSGLGMYTMSGVGRYSESGVGLYSESGVGMYTMSGVGVTGMSGIGMMSGVGLYSESGLGMYTMSGVGRYSESGVGLYTMSGMGMSGVGFSASMPPIRPRQFWLIADAELIVYGATEPDATVTIGGRPVKLNPDGTFRFQMSFQDGLIDFPIMAVAADGEQTRSIHLKFNRETPERRTNTKEEAVLEWLP
ncbi:MAG: DUF4912 domain-containing protein [Synechococcales cyanobacterium M58_A2018_015]|nr:DUF4912 domain-containing protein [Synechococcales cyanobacterium M58_A2018_015]